MNNKNSFPSHLSVFLSGPQKFIQLLAASLLALLAVEALFFLSPELVTAKNNSADFLRNGLNNAINETRLSTAQEEQQDFSNVSRLPDNKNREIKYEYKSDLTAYNSEASQCSGNPCITANGYNVCRATNHNTVAANNLPLGTKVKIPELFGDKVFVVRDRMNSRYSRRMDVWMQKKQQAKKFGVKYATIQVLE